MIQPSDVIQRLTRATTHSLQGLRYVITGEFAFRLEVILSVIIIPLGLHLGHTATEKVLLCGSWLLVLIIETVNTAIETLVNRISLDHHPLSGRAKDLGSAAVFITLLLAALTWLLILVF